jgi:CheY-like chemotaxis protein
MSGHELATRLRARWPTLRRVAVTGWGQPEDRRRTAAAGFDAHLVKPVDADALLRLVADWTAADAT